MESKTKDRILEEALILFATNGYHGSNLRDLAARLGLTKSALYKHYASKEDIWNALIEKLENYYHEHFGSLEKLPEAPKSCDELLTLTMRMVDFTIHDQKIILTRRLLLIEQFHDERACKLATLHFLTEKESMFTHIFAQMEARGLLKQDDPALLARAYTAPIAALIHLCDREPEQEPEIVSQIEAFIRHFIRTYQNENLPS